MALRDVKKYYYDVQAQLLGVKADVEDFNAALDEGYITEDRLTGVIDDLNLMQVNYDRLTYIMYLLELPVNKKKRTKYRTMNAELEAEFCKRGAMAEQVLDENASALTRIRQELKAIKEDIKTKSSK